MQRINNKIRRILDKIKGLPDYIKNYRYRNQIFLVYTMGKVGYSIVYESLKQILPYNNIIHIHFLSEFMLQEELPKTNK